jgi:hypothetical protein
LWPISPRASARFPSTSRSSAAGTSDRRGPLGSTRSSRVKTSASSLSISFSRHHRSGGPMLSGQFRAVSRSTPSAPSNGPCPLSRRRHRCRLVRSPPPVPRRAPDAGARRAAAHRGKHLSQSGLADPHIPCYFSALNRPSYYAERPQVVTSRHNDLVWCQQVRPTLSYQTEQRAGLS